MTAMLNLLKDEHKVDDKTPITESLVEEYFKKPEEYKYVNLEAKKHAPLPTKKYYKKYADHMRLLMNEHNSMSEQIRLGYDREVQNQLREVGIDIRDSGLTAQIIRDSLWNKEQVQRIQDYKDQVQGYFFKDDKISEKYYSEVGELINQLAGDKQQWSTEHKDYYQLLNNTIKK
jgi:hypothetical protein